MEERLGLQGQRQFLFWVSSYNWVCFSVPSEYTMSLCGEEFYSVESKSFLECVPCYNLVCLACFTCLAQNLLVAHGNFMFGMKGYYFTWTLIFGGTSNSILPAVLGSPDIAKGTLISIQGKNKSA